MNDRFSFLKTSAKSNKDFRKSTKANSLVRIGINLTMTIASAIFLNAIAIARFPVTANELKKPTLGRGELIAQETIIYVNPSSGSNSNGTGSPTASYATIAYALKQANSGTTVQLAPGTYSEETGEVFPLIVTRGVTLRGDEGSKGENVIIIGGGKVVSPTFARQNVTILAETNSKIVGLTVTNPNQRGTAVWVESSNPTIANNTFVNSLRDGVFVSGTGNPTVINNNFVENDANGISLARFARGEIRGNLFERTGFGISISDRAAPIIAENTIVDNKDGVVVSHSAQPRLRNNLIENNERDGVVAIAQALPDLGSEESRGQNIIRNNGRYDLYNATRGNVILAVGNDIEERGIAGPVEFAAASVELPSVVEASGTFNDVGGHWAQAYIEILGSLGIFSGFEDGSFRPEEVLTRVQFATVVKKAFAAVPRREAFEFIDVSSGFWGYEAIQTAYRGGFISGYRDGSFRSNQAITRLEAIAGLANGLEVAAGDLNVLSVYADADRIPAWATAAVAGATQEGLVVSYPTANLLNPKDPATRAEVAAFIYQALVNEGKLEPIESPYLVRIR